MTSHQGLFSCRITGADAECLSGDGEAIFPYWSFTKTVIAICGLKLVEQGAIDLDAPLPGHAFTLRQLLNHTAGLPDYGALPDYAQAVARGENPWPEKDLVVATMAQGMLFRPGTGWHYSNLGYLLARDRIEQAAGRPLSALIRDWIGEPLGLDSIALATTRDQFAQVHWPKARQYHPGWVYHGCLIGTAPDAARLLHGLFTGRLLNAATRDLMLKTHPLGGAIPGRPWRECGYALGLMNGRWGKAGRAIGHSGGGPFSVNAVYHFPDLQTPVTVASFTDGSDEATAENAALDCALRG